MVNLIGHYFETAVSVLEAARAKGLQPILATHVACPTDIIPDWLETYPLFTVHHWLSDFPVRPAPSIPGFRGDPYAQRQVTIEKVLSGQSTIEEYIRSRIAMPDAPEPTTLDLLSQARAQAVEGPWVEDALATLEKIGCRDDLEAALAYKRDLERLLSLTDFRSRDHVYLATAHGRELLAVALMDKRLGKEHAPQFHLEYRHALYEADPRLKIDPHHYYLALHRACFELYRRWGASPRIHFYTDTEELAQEYQEVTGFNFQVLPIPFRSQALGRKDPEAGQPLCFTYLGEARDEKGFPWLADAIDHLMEHYLRPGKIRFAIQATLGRPVRNQPASAAALARLLKNDPRHVQLSGLNGPLLPEEYNEMVADADVVLCPYHSYRYRNCSSGTLMEAIVAGKPTMVRADGWMARQQPPGSGERFHDLTSFIEGLKRLADEFATYKRYAEGFRNLFRLNHSPERLVAKLIKEEFRAQAPVRAYRMAA
jgi:glycosyltransferase involved in cell wall biosynthesis